MQLGSLHSAYMQARCRLQKCLSIKHAAFAAPRQDRQLLFGSITGASHRWAFATLGSHDKQAIYDAVHSIRLPAVDGKAEPESTDTATQNPRWREATLNPSAESKQRSMRYMRRYRCRLGAGTTCVCLHRKPAGSGCSPESPLKSKKLDTAVSPEQSPDEKACSCGGVQTQCGSRGWQLATVAGPWEASKRWIVFTQKHSQWPPCKGR